MVGAPSVGTKGKAAISTVTGSNRDDVWVRGTDDHLWHAERNGSGTWTAWHDEGAFPSIKGSPAAFTRRASPLVIDIAIRDDNDNIMHRAWVNDHWQNWEFVGMLTSGNPSIGAVASGGRVTIVARGQSPDNTIYSREYVEGIPVWQEGYYYNPPVTGVAYWPAAIYRKGDILDLYIRGTSKNVWRNKNYPQ
jgi:hypothetical protein